MKDLILIVITGVCSVLAIRTPFLGLLTYAGYGLLSPQSYAWGLGRTFPHSKVIAGGILIGYLLSAEAKALPRQRESFLLFAIWSLFGLSTIFGLYPERSLNDFITISKVLFMSFLTMLLVNTEHRLRLFLKVIALSLGAYAIKIGIFVIITGGVGAVEGPENTYIAANNTIGMALSMNVPLLWYLSRQEDRLWLRWVMRFMVAMSYPAVAGTFARGDWIGLAVITGLIAMKARQKFLVLIVALVLAITASTWVRTITSNAIVDRFETLDTYNEDPSVQSRYWNWEFCTRVGLARPLLGGGFSFFSTEAYRIYYPEFLDRWPGKVWSCHNTPLLVLAEHGIPALLVWLGLLISCFGSLSTVRAHGKANNLRNLIDYADMFQVALVGFIIMALFVDFPYYEVFYQIVAAIVVIKERITAKVSSVRGCRVNAVAVNV